MPRSFLIDTDTASDDAVAIIGPGEQIHLEFEAALLEQSLQEVAVFDLGLAVVLLFLILAGLRGRAGQAGAGQWPCRRGACGGRFLKSDRCSTLTPLASSSLMFTDAPYRRIVYLPVGRELR